MSKFGVLFTFRCGDSFGRGQGQRGAGRRERKTETKKTGRQIARNTEGEGGKAVSAFFICQL